MAQKLILALVVVRLSFAFVLLTCALQWRSSLFVTFGMQALTALILLSLGLIAIEVAVWWRVRAGLLSVLSIATALVAFASLGTTVAREGQFLTVRQQVLEADPVQLERLGRHFIIGYRDPAEIRRLIERRAIAGVFVAAHNVWRKSAEQIRSEIDALQAIRQQQGLPPLLMVTDQEGGGVSRMSPPLHYFRTLADIVKHNRDEDVMLAAVRAFATDKGQGLAKLGFNLNFSPVVDLNHGIWNRYDLYTRISERAISPDPRIITIVAREYCAGLRETGVRCTLKHFPGLGRVFEDTHIQNANVNVPVETLSQTDWVPFRELMHQSGALTMIGHARIPEIDPKRPASSSPAVIADLLRGQWKHNGILVTDDLTMKAAVGGEGGLSVASVTALNSGIDLILLAFDPDQYYLVMQALMQAEEKGALRRDMLEISDRRLSGAAITAAVPEAR